MSRWIDEDFNLLVQRVRLVQRRFPGVSWVQHGGHHWFGTNKPLSWRKETIDITQEFLYLSDEEVLGFIRLWLGIIGVDYKEREDT